MDHDCCSCTSDQGNTLRRTSLSHPRPSRFGCLSSLCRHCRQASCTCACHPSGRSRRCFSGRNISCNCSLVTRARSSEAVRDSVRVCRWRQRVQACAAIRRREPSAAIA